ncbi:hypothetical protein SCHIN_v1c07420 [Spiroplasma chinense]|uniref:Lipoprotein n=1 Tax=Spiroplasma chinense TaxID=216932 RepID=A0A5B9Y6P7_9MOLU|nr:hypothetical protein [Spiroplasma chinense]QEH61937.1 hypothetical protein SCHIN_v1c07420 [Spiroplasma chinense]
MKTLLKTLLSFSLVASTSASVISCTDQPGTKELFFRNQKALTNLKERFLTVESGLNLNELTGNYEQILNNFISNAGLTDKIQSNSIEILDFYWLYGEKESNRVEISGDDDFDHTKDNYSILVQFYEWDDNEWDRETEIISVYNTAMSFSNQAISSAFTSAANSLRVEYDRDDSLSEVYQDILEQYSEYLEVSFLKKSDLFNGKLVDGVKNQTFTSEFTLGTDISIKNDELKSISDIENKKEYEFKVSSGDALTIDGTENLSLKVKFYRD